VECNANSLIIAREKRPRGLYEEGGWLVYDGGGPLLTTEQANRLIEEGREKRIEHILSSGFDQ
jgi:hypothetical protein